jgi:hypothetical protein
MTSQSDAIKVPNGICCECKRMVDHCTPASEPNIVPEPGDTTLCIGCGAVNVFTDDLTLRAPTDEEMSAALAEPIIQMARRAIFVVKRDEAIERLTGNERICADIGQCAADRITQVIKDNISLVDDEKMKLQIGIHVLSSVLGALGALYARAHKKPAIKPVEACRAVTDIVLKGFEE